MGTTHSISWAGVELTGTLGASGIAPHYRSLGGKEGVRVHVNIMTSWFLVGSENIEL